MIEDPSCEPSVEDGSAEEASWSDYEDEDDWEGGVPCLAAVNP